MNSRHPATGNAPRSRRMYGVGAKLCEDRQHLQRIGERFGAFFEVLLEKAVAQPADRAPGEGAGYLRVRFRGLEKALAVGWEDPTLPRRKKAGPYLRP